MWVNLIAHISVEMSRQVEMLAFKMCRIVDIMSMMWES